VPIVLLMIEFSFNNIPFSWRHLPVIFGLNISYILVQISYCEIKKTTVYPGMDWVNNPQQASVGALAVIFVTLVFFSIFKFVNCIKFKINGVERLLKTI